MNSALSLVGNVFGLSLAYLTCRAFRYVRREAPELGAFVGIGIAIILIVIDLFLGLCLLASNSTLSPEPFIAFTFPLFLCAGIAGGQKLRSETSFLSFWLSFGIVAIELFCCGIIVCLLHLLFKEVSIPVLNAFGQGPLLARTGVALLIGVVLQESLGAPGIPGK